MLHLRNEESIPFPETTTTQLRRSTMERMYRALGLALALGTSGLMFALTLA
jgi:hypothetical protein